MERHTSFQNTKLTTKNTERVFFPDEGCLEAIIRHADLIGIVGLIAFLAGLVVGG